MPPSRPYLGNQCRRRHHRRTGRPSACCVSSWCPARWCTASSPTVARPRNVIPARAEIAVTPCVPTTAASLREARRQEMADCFLAGAVATGCEYRVRETRAPLRRAGSRPVAGGHLPRGRWCGWAGPRSPRTWRRRCRWAAPIWGNVTQVMPGIHPIVGIDAGRRVGAPTGVSPQLRQGRAPDKAVVEGAIMAGPHRRQPGRDSGPSGTGCWKLQARRAS